MRSRNPRTKKFERLYVIKGLTFDGLDIYTKGKMLEKKGESLQKCVGGQMVVSYKI